MLDEKVSQIKDCIRPWARGKAGKKRELLSLLGRLQHCYQAIVLGRPFLRRLIDRAHSVRELHHHVRLSSWELDDIRWWGESWQRKRIVFRCDNMAVVQCLINGTCRDRHLAYLLLELSILAILNNFYFYC